MGSIEINFNGKGLLIYSHIITYGNAADETITASIREEIETMWNEAHGHVHIKGQWCTVVFKITASFQPGILPVEVYRNTDPRNNYFRIEEFAYGNISLSMAWVVTVGISNLKTYTRVLQLPLMNMGIPSVSHILLTLITAVKVCPELCTHAEHW